VLLTAVHIGPAAANGPPEKTASSPPEEKKGGAANAVSEVLAAVQQRYDKIVDIRADFEQRAWVASLGREDRAEGRVSILRPGRMRWEYNAPEPRVIALDGDTVQLYMPEDEQLQIASAGGGTLPPTALDFLLGDGDLAKTFAVEPIAEERNGEVGLRLRPREDASFEHLDLWVEAGTYQLRESVVVDLFGNRTAVRFSDVEENAGIDASAFELDVPAGTERIDLREYGGLLSP
jgi:outer membrane lipoprotein carrier protein